MPFRKYMHVERLGSAEVEDIELGTCYVFPKIDGTNASVWHGDADGVGYLTAGSRSRELGVDTDNFGFYQWVLKSPQSDRFRQLLTAHPSWQLYGEFLVPHTLKTYRPDSWQRFWIFDVYDNETEDYLPYDAYQPELEKFELDYIPPIAIVEQGTDKQWLNALNQNTFLIKDGEGVGEGIVLKNYTYRNRFGRQCYAKIVRNEFKEQNKKAFGVNEITGEKQIEAEIAQRWVTKALVDKTRAKIVADLVPNLPIYGTPHPNREIVLTREARAKLIPRLLQTVFYDLVREEIWEMLKAYRDPKIDFKELRRQCIHQTKQHALDLF